MKIMLLTFFVFSFSLSLFGENVSQKRTNNEASQTWIDKHHKYGTTPIDYEPVPVFINPDYINTFRNVDLRQYYVAGVSEQDYSPFNYLIPRDPESGCAILR